MPRLVVVGSLNQDITIRTPRFPRPGETLLAGPCDRYPGGKGANQAVAAARLGATVTMLGAVGCDESGAALGANLEANGVGRRLIQVPHRATGIAVITVDPTGENTILVAPGANHELGPDHVAAAADSIAAADAVLLQLEIPLTTVWAAVETAREAGTAVVLNAAPATTLADELLRRVDCLVVNHAEALEVLDAAPDLDGPQLLEALHARTGGLVVVTYGRDGARAFDGRTHVVQDAFDVRSVDAVSAGDAFVGALATALAEATPVAQALRFACAAGALATTRAGAQPSLPRRDEVALLANGGGEPQNGPA